MSEYRRIPCVIQRGGTSKGVYIHEKDLPADEKMRTQVILAIFGSPDVRQIDGLGGADPLTSKCAIIGPSDRPDADVNYTMAQVGITDALIDFKGNCGNISSGVGPFAIDEGLVEAHEPETVVRIYNTNTKKILKAYVRTRGGKSEYTGDYAIDGVPGTGSKILLDYSATGGTLRGALLPTGRPVDKVPVPSLGEVEIWQPKKKKKKIFFCRLRHFPFLAQGLRHTTVVKLIFEGKGLDEAVRAVPDGSRCRCSPFRRGRRPVRLPWPDGLPEGVSATPLSGAFLGARREAPCDAESILSLKRVEPHDGGAGGGCAETPHVPVG